jgi:hypothetical protein
MKKIYILTFLLAFILNANAQIIFNNNDLPMANDTARYTIADPEWGIDPFDTGADHEWDFSYFKDFDPLSQRIDTVFARSAANVGYTSSFLGGFTSAEADYFLKQEPPFDNFDGIELSNYNVFFKRSSANLKETGFGVTISGFPFPKKYAGEKVIYKLPIDAENDLNRMDTSAWNYAFDLTSTLGYYYYQEGQRINTVEGWGTLISPLDTFQVIKMKSEMFFYDSVYVAADSSSFAFNRPKQTDYIWICKEYGLPLFVITTFEQDGDEIVTNIEYIDSIRYSTVLKTDIKQPIDVAKAGIYPNPYRENAIINYETNNFADVNISVYNLLGEKITTLTDRKHAPGNYTLTFSAKNYGQAAGVYFVKIIVNDKETTHKIVELD